jgi:hypothetical protein
VPLDGRGGDLFDRARRHLVCGTARNAKMIGELRTAPACALGDVRGHRVHGTQQLGADPRCARNVEDIDVLVDRDCKLQRRFEHAEILWVGHAPL